MVLNLECWPYSEYSNEQFLSAGLPNPAALNLVQLDVYISVTMCRMMFKLQGNMIPLFF